MWHPWQMCEKIRAPLLEPLPSAGATAASACAVQPMRAVNTAAARNRGSR
jgi:hypothetical protein